MNKRLLQLDAEVREALSEGRAVVALESTVISHGLPYPTNLETARCMEGIVRQNGAVPATVAVLGGQLRVGLADAELEYLALAKGIRKTSRRDLPVVVAAGADGATTVAATATISAWAGIGVLATGGIGGVHRAAPGVAQRDAPHQASGAAPPDISNDLPTLASVPVAVVCSGAKSILDLRATLEWLETAGVPVIGFETDEFPAFYCRRSGLRVDVRVDKPAAAAAIIRAARALGLGHGMLITVPVPVEAELSQERMDRAIAAALRRAQATGVTGSAVTPFLLEWLSRETEGASLRANVTLLENNARVAAQIAAVLAAEPAAEGEEA